MKFDVYNHLSVWRYIIFLHQIGLIEAEDRLFSDECENKLRKIYEYRA